MRKKVIRRCRFRPPPSHRHCVITIIVIVVVKIIAIRVMIMLKVLVNRLVVIIVNICAFGPRGQDGAGASF